MQNFWILASLGNSAGWFESYLVSTLKTGFLALWPICDISTKSYEMTNTVLSLYNTLSHDFASGSEITPCIKIDEPLVVYRLSGNVMK